MKTSGIVFFFRFGGYLHTLASPGKRYRFEFWNVDKGYFPTEMSNNNKMYSATVKIL